MDGLYTAEEVPRTHLGPRCFFFGGFVSVSLILHIRYPLFKWNYNHTFSSFPPGSDLSRKATLKDEFFFPFLLSGVKLYSAADALKAGKQTGADSSAARTLGVTQSLTAELILIRGARKDQRGSQSAEFISSVRHAQIPLE